MEDVKCWIARNRPATSRNQMKRFLTVDYGVSDQVTVERCQLAAVSNGQGQQITVSHLARVEQASAINALAIQKGNVIRPELMPAERAQDRDQLSRRCRSSWRIRIARMANNAKYTVLSQRTGSPGMPARSANQSCARSCCTCVGSISAIRTFTSSR